MDRAVQLGARSKVGNRIRSEGFGEVVMAVNKGQDKVGHCGSRFLAADIPSLAQLELCYESDINGKTLVEISISVASSRATVGLCLQDAMSMCLTRLPYLSGL